MKFQVIFLGTGTSQGVPVIGCECQICQSGNDKDNRLRSSLLVKTEFGNILIDIGPDFRQQMLNAKTTNLNSVLITHQHRDHTAGLDDLRPIYYFNKQPIEIYGEKLVVESLKNDFNYLFNGCTYPGKPKININIIENNPFFISELKIIPIRVMHYKLPILGYRIGGVSYITDANYIDSNEKEKIMGSKILIINSLQKEKHISHYNLIESLELIEELKPEKAYLTHISHNMGLHNEVSKELPDNVFLAYDNLSITI